MEFFQGNQESRSESVGNRNKCRGRRTHDEPEQGPNGGGDSYIPRKKVEFPWCEGGKEMVITSRTILSVS